MVERKTHLLSFRVEKTIQDWLKSLGVTTGRSEPDILRQIMWNAYHMAKKQELDTRVTKEYYAKQLNDFRQKIDKVFEFLSVEGNRDTIAEKILEMLKTFEMYGVAIEKIWEDSAIQPSLNVEKKSGKKRKSNKRTVGEKRKIPKHPVRRKESSKKNETLTD